MTRTFCFYPKNVFLAVEFLAGQPFNSVEVIASNYSSMGTKGGFLSESAICFSNLQIFKKNIPKNYPELKIQISRQ